MRVEDTAFHEMTVVDGYVIHEAVVRNDSAWIGLASDERWHAVRVQFDTIVNLAKIWVNDSRYNRAPDFTLSYTGHSKSEIKVMSMKEVLDWVLI